MSSIKLVEPVRLRSIQLLDTPPHLSNTCFQVVATGATDTRSHP